MAKSDKVNCTYALSIGIICTRVGKSGKTKKNLIVVQVTIPLSDVLPLISPKDIMNGGIVDPNHKGIDNCIYQTWENDCKQHSKVAEAVRILNKYSFQWEVRECISAYILSMDNANYCR